MTQPIQFPERARYWVFAGDVYYASGGWNDFRGQFDLLSEAQAWLIKWEDEEGPLVWGHIVDTLNGVVVYSIQSACGYG